MGDGLERPGQSFGEDAARLGKRVDVRIRSVPLVGQLLHQHIVVVAHAKAERAERNALASVSFNRGENAFRGGFPHIGDTVRAENDPVDRIRRKGLCSHFVAEAQPFFGIGRAFGQEVVERLDNCRLVLGRCRIEQLSAFGAVDDDAYLVFFLQLVNQDAEAFFDQLQTVFLVHGPGNVDHEDEVGLLPVCNGDFLAFYPDAEQVVARTKRRGASVCMDRECILGGRLVGERKVIDKLFHADSIRRRQ